MDSLKTRPGFRPARTTPGQIAGVQTLAEAHWAEGDYVIFLRSHDKRAALQRVAVDGGPLLQLTSDPPAAPAAAYAGGLFDVSEDQVVYTADDGRLMLMPLTGGPGRPVATVAGTRSLAPAFSRTGTRIAFVTDDGQSSDVGVVATREGAWPQILRTDGDFVIDPAWHPDERHLAWIEWDVPNMGWDESRLVICDVSTGVRRVVQGDAGVSVSQPRWAPDGRHLAFLCDRTGYLNLWLAKSDGSEARVLVEEAHEHGTAPWASGTRTYTWAPDGGSLAYAYNGEGAWRLHVVDVATGRVRDLNAPPGVYSSLHWSPDGQSLLAAYSGPSTAPQIVVINLASGVWRVLATGAVGGIEDGALAPQAIRWQAPDGLTIPGLLYLPALTVGQRAPLLVWIHGGPTGQSQVAFNPVLQYFLQRGWAVLLPNHRGSTGYGRAFTQAQRGEWGRADMADIVAGVDALLTRGDIDGTRVVPIGGSAGGYAVLQLLVSYPDRFRAGVDLFGVSDHFELARTTHRLEARYLDSIIGPLPESYPVYRMRSPIYHLDAITAPLLILQGADDPVVTPDQAQGIYDALKARGRPVELQIYAGEGHGWLQAATIRDYVNRVDTFLRTYVLLR